MKLLTSFRPHSPGEAAIRLKRMFTRESFQTALILFLILNIDFLPCLWGDKSLLESAQLCQSVLPSGSWQGKRVDLLRYGKTLDPAAAAWITEPYLAVAGQYIRHGELPIWNPYQAFGAPFAAEMLSQPFYPLAAAFSLYVTPTTVNYFILTRLFIAGMCAYLYLRLFVSFPSALAGGIASLLAGYYLLYLTIAHLSVEVLLPGALLAAECLLRKRTFQILVVFAIVLCLTITGGMPESTLLLMVFLYSYILIRLGSDVTLRNSWRRLSCYIIAASVTALFLSALLLLPFIELLRQSYNTHDPGTLRGIVTAIGGRTPGLRHDPIDLSIFTYIFPLIFGHPFAPTLAYNYSGVRNYVGIIAFFLSLIAVVCVRRDQTPEDRTLGKLTGFFGTCILLIVLKRYGVPPINSVGHLPFFRFEFFYKYDEPILSICVAFLSAIGLERLIKRQVSTLVQASALLFTFLLIPLAIFISRQALTKEFFTEHIPPAFPLLAVLLPTCLLFVAAVSILTLGRQAGARSSRYLAMVMVALIAIELSGNYIPELYYTLNHLPDKAENPYVGAPYIKWLKDRGPNTYRVFGRDGALFPNWASVFQLSDIRNLDALFYKKYLPFIRAFLLAPGQVIPDDFQDRFTGMGTYDYAFSTPIQKRLLQLSSAKYLITARPYATAPFKLAYDREIKIYSYDNVLPRAAIYFQAEVAGNENAILRRLVDPDLNVFQTVLLDATKLNPDQVRRVADIDRSSPQPIEAGKIISYEPQSVEVSASLKQNGILVLNDSDYPGWTVSVDGRPSQWFTANYLFRGVLLGPGDHKVRFVYRPRTFYLGLAITAVTALTLAVYGMVLRRKKHFDSR